MEEYNQCSSPRNIGTVGPYITQIKTVSCRIVCDPQLSRSYLDYDYHHNYPFSSPAFLSNIKTIPVSDKFIH